MICAYELVRELERHLGKERTILVLESIWNTLKLYSDYCIKELENEDSGVELSRFCGPVHESFELGLEVSNLMDEISNIVGFDNLDSVILNQLNLKSLVFNNIINYVYRGEFIDEELIKDIEYCITSDENKKYKYSRIREIKENIIYGKF